MTEFVLVRHGETDWNVQQRMQGSSDVPLNENGIAQAKAAAPFLADTVWDLVIASPLSRALRTAELILQELGLDPAMITTDPNLQERHYGLAEGVDFEERRQRWPDDIWPEMETPERMDERTGAVMHQLAEHQAGKRILIVSHGGWIRSALRVVSAYDERTMKIGAIGNTSRSYVSHDGQRWQVGEIGVLEPGPAE